jgi:hypothetical protein
LSFDRGGCRGSLALIIVITIVEVVINRGATGDQAHAYQKGEV